MQRLKEESRTMTEPVRYSYTPDFLDSLVEGSNGKAFRKKIEPCPYCEPNCGMFEKPKFATEWDKEGLVREIVFIRNRMGPYYKKGYAVMVSACPRCKKISFHHRLITQLLYDPWADKRVVQDEINAWEQEALDEWNNSMCVRCSVTKEIEKDQFGYRVECGNHGGSPENPWEINTFKCNDFNPINPNLCVYCGKKANNNGQVHKGCQEKMNEIERISYNTWLKRMHELGSYLDRKELKKGERE